MIETNQRQFWPVENALLWMQELRELQEDLAVASDMQRLLQNRTDSCPSDEWQSEHTRKPPKREPRIICYLWLWLAASFQTSE
eukprot:3591243-Amphidinium_carterae.1